MNYKLAENISWRDIQGQILVLDPRINKQAHELSAVGSFIWNSISNGQSHNEIMSNLCSQFSGQIAEGQIKNDANDFIKTLLALKLITHV